MYGEYKKNYQEVYPINGLNSKCKYLWIEQESLQAKSLPESKNLYLFIFRTKNSKPFRVSKNGVAVNVIKKLNDVQRDVNNNVIHISLNRKKRGSK